MAEKPQPVGAGSAAPLLSFRWRMALSILLLLHVLAVLVPPFTFATSSGPGLASPFAQPIMAAMRPYIDLLFLDHGYFFFAPNPGPSHLLRAKLEFTDGRPPQELTFPDRHRHRPRLLYHRHFMLAEQLHGDFAPPQPPPGISSDPEFVTRWHQSREFYELRRNSFTEHLRVSHGASQVTLRRIEHTLFGPGEFQGSRKPLDVADSYLELPEQVGESVPRFLGAGR